MTPIQTSGGMWNSGRVSENRGRGSILDAFFPPIPATVRPVAYPIMPLGGPFRRWHLTPWQTTEATALVDDLGRLGDDSTDSVDTTDWTDVLNTGIKTAGNVYSASKGLVPAVPRAGQYYPAGTNTLGLGMSTNTLLLLGAGLLGVVLLAKK